MTGTRVVPIQWVRDIAEAERKQDEAIQVELLRFNKQVARAAVLKVAQNDRLPWLESLPDPQPRNPLFDQAWHCLNDLIFLGLGSVDELSLEGLDRARIAVISKWKELPNFKDLRPYLWGDMPPSLKADISRILRG